MDVSTKLILFAFKEMKNKMLFEIYFKKKIFFI